MADVAWVNTGLSRAERASDSYKVLAYRDWNNMVTVIDIHCREFSCEDVSNPDSYEFELIVTTEDNSVLSVPLPSQPYRQDFITACYRILAEGNRNRLDVMMAETVRDRVTEAEWILAALTVL